ncbi:MAG TPA: hypothetical protein VN578_02740 [Candidatus Binatia bacterium]|jgi:hypothetical protein|nr:hypothetical protein [Candidatus Binatia bacterium]
MKRLASLVFVGALAVGEIEGADGEKQLQAPCPCEGEPKYGGEAPFMIDASCVDPDYNEKTFVTDSTKSLSLTLPDGSTIPYTEVKGHFPATRTQAQRPAGVTGSPTTVSHSVTWRFPDKSHWRNRFFQQTYPLPIDFLNTVDSRFAFSNGGYTVSVTPGNFVTGYRVSAAAAKLAKGYAKKLYGNTERIYGYIYGQSGGSVQVMGANEDTTGVWDGIVPVVIATDGLNTHSFQWNALYALRVPMPKRKAIADCSAPGSGRDIYAGLTGDEHAALDELLNAGFARKALETWTFSVGSALPLSGALATFDPTYEDDFWSKPGYEGAKPPEYLSAAKVDGFATITSVERDAKDVIKSLNFDPATVPSLGSIGDEGLQFYVYAADGSSRIVNGDARALKGKLRDNVLAVDAGNDAVLVAALTNGAKIRINNRFLLAACFYPRHSILDNGNPAYNQYKNTDGTPKYVQRPIQTAYIANIGAAGGRRQTGKLKVKTIVLENLSDPASFPYVGGFYAEQVRKALGPEATDQIFRIYYQDNAHHGAFPTMPGPMGDMLGTKVASIAGILNQALLDLAAWAEHGVVPMPSTHYSRDAMNQIVLPKSASQRGGHQPVVELTANGSDRAQTGVNQPVTLVAKIDMPPGAGKVVDYDWYLGMPDSKYEPAIKLANPEQTAQATREVTFPAPGEYAITFRVRGERNGRAAAESTTLLENIARVQIVVR